MATVNLGVGDTGALQAAIQQTARAIQQITREQASATAATRAQTTATAAATGGFQNFSQGATQAVQRIQGVANGIQSLVGHLGGRDRTAGLIGAVAGTTAQFASLGSLFGPIGTVIGGVAGAVGGLVAAFRESTTAATDTAEAERDLRTELERNTERYADYETAIRSANAARAAEALVEFGLATPEAYAAREQDLIDQIAVRSRVVTGIGVAIDEYEREMAALVATGETTNAAGLSLDEMSDTVARLGRESRDAQSDAMALDTQLQSLRTTAANAAQEVQEVLLEDLTGGGDTPPTRRGGGRARPEAAPERATNSIDAMNTRDDARVTRDLEAFDAERERIAGIAAMEAEVDARMREADREEVAALAAKADAQKAAAEEILASQREVSDALAEFSRGDVGSLESVIDAYHDLQNSAKRTGVEINRTGLLMSRGMTATGNQIADTIGSQMTGAFNEALGAWMDGSKTFVEAAEGMAKGVIKALTQEAIVQAVTEIARSIASFASQDYAGGIAHAGAAAAWAAVGIAAGAVGAATGAFGGGGAKDAGTSTKDMANADRERQRGGELGTTVINVYADNLPVTQGDLDRVMTGMVRRGIERHGERFPGLSR